MRDWPIHDHVPDMRTVVAILDRPGLVVGRIKGEALWMQLFMPAWAMRSPGRRQYLLDRDELGDRVAGRLESELQVAPVDRLYVSLARQRDLWMVS